MCPEGTRCTGTDDPEKSPCTPELPPEPCPGSYSDFQCIDSRRYCLVSRGSTGGLTASLLSLHVQGRRTHVFGQRRAAAFNSPSSCGSNLRRVTVLHAPTLLPVPPTPTPP